MSEADGKCAHPRPDDAPECTQGYDHTGHCDWWEQFGLPVVEQARRNQAARERHDESCAHCRRDARIDAERITRKQLADAIDQARYLLAQWDVDGWAETDFADTPDWAEDAARALRRLVNATDELAGLSDE